MLRGHIAVNLEKIDRASLVAPELETDAGIRVIAIYEITQVRVRNGGTQHEPHVKVATRLCRRDAFRPMERHDDVGKLLLGADKVARVGFPALEFLQHLLGGVAALGRIALDFPLPPHLFRWGEIDSDIVELPHGWSGKAQQALDDDKLAWPDILGSDKGASGVVVHRLEDRLTVMQTLQVQLDHVHVIALGMQRRDTALRAFLAVVFVIVVGANVRDAVDAEDVHEPLRDRRFTGCTVAYNTENDRALSGHRYTSIRFGACHSDPRMRGAHHFSIRHSELGVAPQFYRLTQFGAGLGCIDAGKGNGKFQRSLLVSGMMSGWCLIAKHQARGQAHWQIVRRRRPLDLQEGHNYPG